LIARLAVVLALLTGTAETVLAHPHVWVVTRSEIVFDATGQLVGVRHNWVFDKAYSAFAVTGFDSHKDGKPDPEKLAELAKTNIESLDEFGYFTQAKINGHKAPFTLPSDYALTFTEGHLTLRFFLPLKAPIRPKVMALQVDDPSFFVAFNFAEGDDAVTLAGTSKGCALNLKRPDKPAEEGTQLLADDVALALKGKLTDQASVGADFTGHIVIACP
jgi:ABC-type uncharacterized transport system substrate-binding protein